MFGIVKSANQDPLATIHAGFCAFDTITGNLFQQLHFKKGPFENATSTSFVQTLSCSLFAILWLDHDSFVH